ncbi:MAG: 23S rRNA (pseudouridine(1915)-N(3))-methyltransferase RlmH [Vicingus serpentipes]|nr:23S rRNA (pseudouridine(1915)-N(3))-methyltransferase RlmH [Vicingus serpentipes]
MKVKLIIVGKTDESYLNEGIAKYVGRLKHYIDFEIVTIPDVKMGKKGNPVLQKEKEGELILSNVNKTEFIVLLDEKGREYSSVGFSEFIQKRMNASVDVSFVIGGPFGFSDDMYNRANAQLSLSQMTFSHQMIRLFFVEQLYRAFSILKGEKYHHI